MVDNCIFADKNVYYLSLMSQYIKKGDIDGKKNNYHHDYGRLSTILVKLFGEKKVIFDSNNLSQFLFYFLQLCQNSGIKLSKSAIEEALNKCKNTKCKEMLNQYIEKEYIK